MKTRQQMIQDILDKRRGINENIEVAQAESKDIFDEAERLDAYALGTDEIADEWFNENDENTTDMECVSPIMKEILG